jgi:hypothetical protein
MMKLARLSKALLTATLFLLSVSGALAETPTCKPNLLRLQTMTPSESLNYWQHCQEPSSEQGVQRMKEFEAHRAKDLPDYSNRYWWTDERIRDSISCGRTFDCGFKRGQYEAKLEKSGNLIPGAAKGWLEKNGLGIFNLPDKLKDAKKQVDAIVTLQNQFLNLGYPYPKPVVNDPYMRGFMLGRYGREATGL